MGDLYEDVAQAVIYAVDPTVVCKHNDYIMIESRGVHYKRTQVDIHAYKDGGSRSSWRARPTSTRPCWTVPAPSLTRSVVSTLASLPLCSRADATDPDSAAWFADG